MKLAAVAGVAAVPTLVAAPAMAAPGDNFSCRATAASIKLLGSTPLEPVVANNPGAPCRSEDKSNGNPANAGTATIGALQAQTIASEDAAAAEARVADLGVDVGGIIVRVEGVNASATYTCVNGQVIGASSSNVAAIKILGIPIDIPDPSAPFTLDLSPILTIKLNERVVSGTLITQNAVVIESALLDTKIVLGQAQVDTKGICSKAGAGVGTPGGTEPKIIYVSVPGSVAGLNTGGLIPGSCLSKDKEIRVRGRGIRQTQFFLDGKRVKTVNRSQDSRYTIDADKLPLGPHRLRAVVVFQNRAIKNKTLNLAFQRCGPSGVDLPLTAQFGKCVNMRITAVRPGKVFVALYSGRDSVRAFGQKLVTFTAPGTKTICLRVPNRARNFNPRTTRLFATAVVRINGKIVTRRIQIS